jgi:hypothetical protein
MTESQQNIINLITTEFQAVPPPCDQGAIEALQQQLESERAQANLNAQYASEQLALAGAETAAMRQAYDGKVAELEALQGRYNDLVRRIQDALQS